MSALTFHSKSTRFNPNPTISTGLPTFYLNSPPNHSIYTDSPNLTNYALLPASLPYYPNSPTFYPKIPPLLQLPYFNFIPPFEGLLKYDVTPLMFNPCTLSALHKICLHERLPSCQISISVSPGSSGYNSQSFHITLTPSKYSGSPTDSFFPNKKFCIDKSQI